MRRAIQNACGLIAVLGLGVLASFASAADVQIQVSSQEVYVGMPFVVRITIRDANDYRMPEVPAADGLDVVGPPQVGGGSFQITINGRRQDSRTTTLDYQLIARTAGRLTIPAITLSVDGQTFVTEPIGITAVEPDAGDLLYVEIVPEKRTVHLGESIDLTLRIWIKPYEDAMLRDPLPSDTMWSRIDVDRSMWGDFLEPIRDMTSGRIGFGFDRRPLRGRDVERENADGVPERYYLYEVAVSLWPTQGGQAEIQPVAIMMQYPVRLQRSRSLLSRGDLELAETRLLVAGAEAPEVEVVPPPEEGRPPFFSGAVGRYDILVTAKPVEVAVGDPITLTMRVTDRSPGTSRLDLLQPPPLDRVPDLTADFRVSGDPLAGVVEGRTKTFTETIRADNDRVDEIPPIPFAYFDPDSSEYRVARSDPVRIVVKPAAVVAPGDVIGGDPSSAAPTELTEVAGGLLANDTGVEAVLASQRFTFGWLYAVGLALPPGLFLGVAVGQRRRQRLRNDHGYARRRTARRTALSKIRAARGDGAAGAVDAVAAAVGGYVADRCNLPPGVTTRGEVVTALRTRRVASDLVELVETVLAECERRRYAGGTPSETESIAARARECVERLERESMR